MGGQREPPGPRCPQAWRLFLLGSSPYALLVQPLIHATRVAELHHLLGLMAPETLRDLYPGLRVLLRRPGERV